MATLKPDRLPLTLGEHTSGRDTARLPLALDRQGGITPPPPKPPPQAKVVRISSCSGARVAPTVDITACLPALGQPAPTSNCLPANIRPVVDVGLCQRHAITPVPSLGNCQATRISASYRITNCQRISIGGNPAIANCAAPRSTAAVRC